MPTIRSLRGHGERVNAVAVAGTGRLLSGSSDGTARVWDVGSHEQQERIFVDGEANQVALASDGQRLAYTAGGRWWLAAVGRGGSTPIAPKDGWTAERIWFSAKDEWLAARWKDGRLELWGEATGNQLLRPEIGPQVREARFSARANRVVAIHDRTLYVVDAASGAVEREIRLESRCYDAVLLLGGRRLAAACEDYRLRFIATDTGTVEGVVPIGPDGIEVLETSPDDQWLAMAVRGTVTVLDAATRAVVVRVTDTSAVWAVAFLGEGTLVTRSKDGQVRLWHVPTGRELCGVDDFGPASSIAASGDGTVLALGLRNEVRVLRGRPE